MNEKNKNLNLLKKMTGMAVFAALAYAVTFVFRIPVMFLTFDAKDAVLVIASFMFGPLSSIIMSLLCALIELATISDTGIYGCIMNFISSAAFAFCASFIYKYKRTLNGAIISLYLSSLFTVGVMMIANLLITPHYMGVSVADVRALIPTVLFPFNLAKTLMNSAFAMLLYKPIVLAMKKAHLVKTRMEAKFDKKSILMLIVGALTLTAAITLFIYLKAN